VFKPGDEIKYNQIVECVMKRHGVTINDMYRYAKPVINMDKPAPHGFAPFFFDKKSLYPPVVDAITCDRRLPPIERASDKSVKQ